MAEWATIVWEGAGMGKRSLQGAMFGGIESGWGKGEENQIPEIPRRSAPVLGALSSDALFLGLMALGPQAGTPG
jgi:hypothetical protein